MAFTDLQIEAEALFGPVDGNQDWQILAVRQVFRACTNSALTLERIELIICAIHGIANNKVPGLRDALNALKKMGALRNRRAQGDLLWEVNFS